MIMWYREKRLAQKILAKLGVGAAAEVAAEVEAAAIEVEPDFDEAEVRKGA